FTAQTQRSWSCYHGLKEKSVVWSVPHTARPLHVSAWRICACVWWSLQIDRELFSGPLLSLVVFSAFRASQRWTIRITHPYRRTTRIPRRNGQASQGVLRFSVSSPWLRPVPPHGQGRAGAKCHEREGGPAPIRELLQSHRSWLWRSQLK